jgi:hypothetical protein
MSTVAMTLFVLVFLGMCLYALRLPALVIPLAIMTYAYKQIISIAIPTLQDRGAIFNYFIASIIMIIFIYHLTNKVREKQRLTPRGKFLLALAWAFLGYFWLSILWSPYRGNDSWKFLPYFLVYFGVLPTLTEGPESMLRAYRLTWGATFLAALCLALSPEFYVSPDIGRMVTHFKAGPFREGSPLALADMGAYLILMSLCIILTATPVNRPKSIGIYVSKFFGGLGILLGLWLTFNTSRGETFTGVACACLLVALVKGRTAGHSLKWMFGLTSLVALSLALLFLLVLPRKTIASLSWRYSSTSMMIASSDRADLTSKTVTMALSSPKNFLFGIGARGCEQRLGIYPHNHFVQALGETGIIGLGLLCLSSLLTIHYGFRTLGLARGQADHPALLFTALMLSLLIYQLIVLSKKGSLTFVDTTMWLALAVFSFDRTHSLLQGSVATPLTTPSLWHGRAR